MGQKSFALSKPEPSKYSTSSPCPWGLSLPSPIPMANAWMAFGGGFEPIEHDVSHSFGKF